METRAVEQQRAVGFKVTDYRVVAEHKDSMSKVISDAVNEGWQLYGNPFSHHENIVQVLIKAVPVFQGQQTK